ncbi:TAXI family TRAP transporter solute-binding subunit [Ornithinicoccus halotolerans]|uniref:TAXI family TRAP transporter solute-binding subunit n=1 Tax=Ornithinicoccus halotolerans TaxID=1748220 RepID=UPI00225E676C|nr:TAXI family TRAP transporter solute-binding subunit [Ornithinicoccus halotolerans]
MMTATAAGLVLVSLAACGGDDGGDSNGGDGGGDTTGAATGQEGDFVTDLTFGTGGAAGTYFPLGSEYANILEDNVDGITVNAIETGASVENLGQIFQEQMQLGLTQNDTAIAAINGEGDFEGAQVDNVGWMGKLYPEAAHIITLESAGIESVEDLEGKRVAVGPPGSGTRAVSDAILAAHGIEEGDYEAFEEEFGDAQGLLQDGNLDASIFVIGTPSGSLNELAATNDVHLVSLEQSVADEIAADSNFETYTLSSDTYDFLEEDVTTLSVFAALVGSTTQVSPEVGYEITKAIYENADQITLPQGDLITVEEALVGQGDVPLHPGAEQYFQEQGLLNE